jgi:predicted MFS family arabinose efflux permease
MGAALWVASALGLFLIARIVPPGRRQNYLLELVIALTVAILCGVAATALDFGGWRTTDWRALLFVLLGTSAAIGALRVGNLLRN